jgi:hypothetical protein
MNFPSRSALVLLAAGFVLSVAWAQSDPAGSTHSTTRKGKKRPVHLVQADPFAKAETDSLQREDSLARFAPVRVLDSLWHLDSLRRTAHPRHHDTIAEVRLDSARRADSLVALEARRRSDSLERARTWFVAKPRDFSQSPEFSQRLQTRLALELGRSGKARPAPGLDTNSGFDGSWKSARASGSAKMLYTALYSGAQGSRNAMGWVFDLASGRKVDSATGKSAGDGDRSADGLASDLLRALLPSATDSVCLADSLAQVRSLWTVAQPANPSSDSTASRVLLDSLEAGMRGSPLAGWKALTWGSCHDLRCFDSTAAAAGIERVLQSTLFHPADSSWVLLLRVVRAKDDSLIDSFRVAATRPSLLAARAVPELLRSPESCVRSCARRSSRVVWSFAVSGDGGTQLDRTALFADLRTAFRARLDRQFLPSATDVGHSAGQDSAACAMGVQRLAVATVSGDDSMRTLHLRVLDLRSGAVDSLVLRRGGPAIRVLSWFARHVASFGAADEPSCGNTCRTDSLRLLRTNWAVAPSEGLDSASGARYFGQLAEFLPLQRTASVVSLPGGVPCPDPSCYDSIASAHQIGKILRSDFSRGPDSAWHLAARVYDVATDEWTDSVRLRDSGAVPGVFARLARGAWDSLLPVARPCDSCVSRDTLEAALAVVAPVWSGAPDSLAVVFRDTLARLLSRNGAYQLLGLRRVDSLAGDLDSSSLARLRCRLGAAFVLRTSAAMDKDGWRVKATLTEISTGRIVGSAETFDKTAWPSRPIELSPWIAHRLLGTDSTAAPPPSTHAWSVPWFKIVALVVPLILGAASVVSHW